MWWRAAKRSWGLLLLAIWLIWTGLLAFVPGLSPGGQVLALLAIAAGVLIILDR